MKTYTFTYFNGYCLESFHKAHEFTCTGQRLSQALSRFADFFNSLSGYKDFSPCYKLNTDRSTEFRYFKAYYFDLFEVVLPEPCQEI